MSEEPIPSDLGEAWAELADGFEVAAGANGLLHRTLYVSTGSGRQFVLQRVNPVFSVGVHDNVAAVTSHLAARGVPTFRLVPASDGASSVDLHERGRWRLLTRLAGVSFHRVQSLEQVRSAAVQVARFHSALDDFDGRLAPMGLPFRETARYRDALDQALARSPEHARHAAVSALRDRIEAGFEALGPAPRTRERVIHADLKISNVLFAGSRPPERDVATALIDFDTLMRAPLWAEWGDAWRSWCNRSGEDERRADFDLEVFEASVEGIVAGVGSPVEPDERESLVDATERMALELATRYATDVLEGRYFAWDEKRFADGAAHNLVRAEGQISLFEAARAVRRERERVLLDRLRR